MRSFAWLCVVAVLVAAVNCRPDKQAAAEVTKSESDQAVASDDGDLDAAESGFFGHFGGYHGGYHGYGHRFGYGGFYGGYPYGGYPYHYPYHPYGHGFGYHGYRYAYGFPYY